MEELLNENALLQLMSKCWGEGQPNSAGPALGMLHLELCLAFQVGLPH